MRLRALGEIDTKGGKVIAHSRGRYDEIAILGVRDLDHAQEIVRGAKIAPFCAEFSGMFEPEDLRLDALAALGAAFYVAARGTYVFDRAKTGSEALKRARASAARDGARGKVMVILEL